jgi:RNA polymerase sigma factor (TIGR02999 family)
MDRPVRETANMSLDAHSITHLLGQWRAGDADAFEQLLPIIYDQLHQIAHRHLRGESRRDLLQTTALVNETYLRLKDLRLNWQDRAHFLAVAAQAMRRILVDEARRRNRDKRGRGEPALPIHDLQLAEEADSEVLALDDALLALAKFDRRKGQIIELRFFGGLTLAETAEVLTVSRSTVERELKIAKAWLAKELTETSPGVETSA